jgi:hypothetical protein
MTKPMLACLEAFLNAGCRTVRICHMAVVERKRLYLKLAIRRRCPCDQHSWCIAASSGDCSLLKAVDDAAVLTEAAQSNDVEQLTDKDKKWIKWASSWPLDIATTLVQSVSVCAAPTCPCNCGPSVMGH